MNLAPMDLLQPLALPPHPFKLTDDNGQLFIFDEIRKRKIMLTPEEWVRQHFIHYLIHTCKFPKTLFKVETGLVYNTLNKRSDIKVYNRQGSVFMLVECKAYSIPISSYTLKQIAAYNKTIEAEWLVVTNGFDHFVFQREGEGDAMQFAKRTALPIFG